MDRSCDSCGETYTAKRSTSKYCSTKCRTRASRGGGKVVELPAKAESPPALAGGVYAATKAALEAAERIDTPLGQTCLVIARRLDSPGLDTGSAISSLADRLDKLLASATKGTGRKTAPQALQDELAERRAQHGA